MVRLLISAIPFCWGVYGALFSWRIPLSARKSPRNLLTSFPPLSERKISIHLPFRFLTWWRDSGESKCCSTSDLVFMKKMVHQPLKSSLNVSELQRAIVLPVVRKHQSGWVVQVCRLSLGQTGKRTDAFSIYATKTGWRWDVPILL